MLKVRILSITRGCKEHWNQNGVNNEEHLICVANLAVRSICVARLTVRSVCVANLAVRSTRVADLAVRSI